jgi:hypothetical protein
MPASCGHPGCREPATCARDPGRCERPARRRGNSNAPGYGAMSRELHSNPADHRWGGKKIFCCVTTRGRNIRVLSGFGRGFGSLTALPLRLGMAPPGCGILAVLGLAPPRLPTTDFPLTLRVVTVALVPTPRHVLTITPLAQASPQPRSTCSGFAPTSCFNVRSAHGSCNSQGKSSGRMCLHSPRAFSIRAADPYSPVYSPSANETAK